MTPSKPGNIVLIRFPFSALHSAKKRPAVVLSPPEYSNRHGDVVVLGLTSVPQPEPQLALEHWQQAGLLAPTWFKPALFTLAITVVERHIGILHPADARRLPDVLKLLIASEYRSIR